MRNTWLLRVAGTLCVVALAAAALGPMAVLADEGDLPPVPDPSEVELPEIEEAFEVVPKFPAMEGPADSTFLFEVEFTYRSGDPGGRSFDLTVVGPPDWMCYAAESSMELERQISAIHIEPYTVKQPIVVVAVAPFWLYPEPGEYPIELRVTGGDLGGVADLTATITPRYSLDAETATGVDTARTSVGSETTLAVNVINTGTARMENVTLSATLPPDVNGEAWDISFEPPQITNLAPGSDMEVQVSITPPGEVVPGDYVTTLSFDGAPALSSAPPSVPIRVLVSDSPSWSLIAVVIAALVVVGGVFGYRQFTRRKV